MPAYLLRRFAFTILLIGAGLIPGTFSLAHAHGAKSADDEASLRASVEMLRRIFEGAPELVDAPVTAPATVKVGGHTVQFDGAFHGIFRTMMRTYDEALRTDCESCAAWDPAWFDKKSAEIEPEVVDSYMRRKLIDPALETIEHVAFGAGRLGGELGKAAFLQKVMGEVGETALSLLWAKILGPIHIFCHAIDAWIVFGTDYLQTYGRVFTRQRQFGNSGLNGIKDAIRFAHFSGSVRRGLRHATFEMGPFSVSEADLRELDLQGSKWWGFADEGYRLKILRRLQKQMGQAATFSLPRKNVTSKRMKRYLFMVTRPTFMAGKSTMDRALRKPQLWVLAAQERIFQNGVTPVADVDAPKVMRESLELSQTAPRDEVREALAAEYAEGDPAKAEFYDKMLRSVEVVYNPKVAAPVRLMLANFMDTVLRAVVYNSTSDILEDKADLVNDGRNSIWVRLNDARKQFVLAWTYGLTARFVTDYFDSLRVATLQTSGTKLFASKYESMELMLKVWQALGQNHSIADVESPAQMKDYQKELGTQYKGLLASRPWYEKFRATNLLPFGFTFHPWSNAKAGTNWFPFYRNLPLCRELQAEPH